MKFIKNPMLTVLFIALFGIFAVGQTENKESAEFVIESKGQWCESNNVGLDILSVLLNENPATKLFIIARAGTGEKASVIKRRLDETEYVVLGIKGFNEKRVIFATGDSIKGEGRLDFYLGSKLFMIVRMKKKDSVCYLTPDYCGRKGELCKNK